MTASSFQAGRLVKNFVQHYNAPPAAVFPLLCPVREYEWIEVWQCEMAWSNSGKAENNCVFTTDFPDSGHETWVVSRYEPDSVIEFVRMATSGKVTRLDIHLKDNGDGTTDAQWTHTYTGLNAQGNQAIEKISDADYKNEMLLIQTMLNHYLDTGHMLKGIARHYRQAEKDDAHYQPDS